MLVNLLETSKASFPMLVTALPSIVAGITNLPDVPSSQPVIVTASPVILYFIGLTGASSVGLVSAMGSSGLTSCCFSSTALTSSLGVVGFSPTDSEPSDDDFSPHPPNRRGSRTTTKGAAFMGLWLLADQLYRSATPSLTPTLCFGFAVDGGGCA